VPAALRPMQRLANRVGGSLPVFMLGLLVAAALGALHAFAPGHGKTVMAAYLVSRRGAFRQAVSLAATVAVSHTVGVLVLGLFLTSTSLVGDRRLYSGLSVTSGLLITVVGLALSRRAFRAAAHQRAHAHSHDHEPVGPDKRGMAALGVAGGLVPSPSAIVVLLAGVEAGRTVQGIALVMAYGVGMAGSLVALGAVLARVREPLERVMAARGTRTAARILPVGSALAVVGGGLVLSARALTGVI
jgi:nickel/cobalt exporter